MTLLDIILIPIAIYTIWEGVKIIKTLRKRSKSKGYEIEVTHSKSNSVKLLEEKEEEKK